MKSLSSMSRPSLAEYRANFAQERKKKSKARAAAELAGAGALGVQSVRSGVPRLLDVRLESHSTTKKTANNILKNGGWLDPNYGGTGASNAVGDKGYISSSKNYVHITGRHGGGHPIVGSKAYEVKPDGTRVEMPEKTKYTQASKNPVENVIRRKAQRALYRGIAGENLQNVSELGGMGVLKKVGSLIAGGATGAKGRTLYVGGSDKFFDQNFIPDPDDVALKSSQKVKVYGNRFSATGAAIKREGLLNLMGQNKGRVAAGAAILGAGGYGAYRIGKNALNSLTGKDTEVKPFYRGGKLVRGFKRKRKNR